MNKQNVLSKKDQEVLALDLVNALVACQNMSEAAIFLQDLLTMQEMKTLSKRLRIAKMLIAGRTYEEIQETVHTSHGTIAKIAAWLAESGDGFRKIIEKMPKEDDGKHKEAYSDWDKLKRRYAMHFWPELLLEEIVKSASKKQKDRIGSVLQKLEEKSELHKQLESLLRSKV